MSAEILKLPPALPAGLQAEQALLGTLVLAGASALARIGDLSPGQFSGQTHRSIYQAIIDEAEDSGAVDLVTVAARLARNGGDGSSAYLASLAQVAPGAANIERYAALVRAAAQRRALDAIGANLAERVAAPGADVAELLRDAQTRIAALDAGASATLRKRAFPVVWFNQAQMPQASPAIIKGLLEPGGLCVIYGPSGSGKTFFTQDLFLHVACGTAWRGRKVTPMLVVYIAAEAGTSILKRFIAWRDKKFGETTQVIPLAILTRGPNLLAALDVDKLFEQLRALAEEAGAALGVVVFDTMSRSMPGGDENASEDMTRIIEVADRIRNELAAATVLVHHTGKDATRGARGHSALFAAADTMISVVDSLATIEKLRDGVAGEAMVFRLNVVNLGTDVDGDPITTCVVQHLGSAPPPAPNARQHKLSGVARVALQALQEAIGEHGDSLPETSTIPRGARGITIETWRTQFALRYGEGNEQRDREAVKKAFQRAREALLKVGAIGISFPHVWTP